MRCLHISVMPLSFFLLIKNNLSLGSISLVAFLHGCCSAILQGSTPCMCTSPVLKSSMLEFWKVQHFFVRHFVPRSIVRKGVLPKNCSLLWDWTPSHAQRIYKGQNSENPLRAITFDWSDLRTWFQRLWATFLMLFSGIPHLPTFRHVACVTSRHVT